MRTILESLFTVLKHLFMFPVTLEYPEKKRFQSEAFRGKPVVSGCVGCGVCKQVCPANAITYTKDDTGKVVSYVFDLNKCIFCGNCMYYCPHSAITMTKEFELAVKNKDELKLGYKGGADD